MIGIGREDGEVDKEASNFAPMKRSVQHQLRLLDFGSVRNLSSVSSVQVWRTHWKDTS